MSYSQVDIVYRCNKKCDGFLMTGMSHVVTIHLSNKQVNYTIIINITIIKKQVFNMLKHLQMFLFYM